MADAATQPTSWADVLMRGVSGYIDSQVAKNYEVSTPAYNTAGGVGGQAQQTAFGALATNQTMWLAGAVVLALVVLIAIRR
jgi:hypothetical protein